MNGDLEQPMFSIVIPTYNRPGELSKCLESLTLLEAPKTGFEVIVVDDGSDGPLNEVVDLFTDRLDVRLIRKANAGPGPARNLGAAAARGRFLVFTDDDCWPTPRWLRALEARLEQDPDHLVGGRTINRLEENSYSTTSQVILEAVYAFFNANPDDARFFASNNMALSAELFAKVGGFNIESFRYVSEDRELCDRWRHQGYRMTYVPEATIMHGHWLKLRSFCWQHFMYGRGARRYHRVRAARGSGRIWQDMRFHTRLWHLFYELLLRIRFGQRLKVLVLLGVWQVVNATGFFLDPLIRQKKV